MKTGEYSNAVYIVYTTLSLCAHLVLGVKEDAFPKLKKKEKRVEKWFKNITVFFFGSGEQFG